MARLGDERATERVAVLMTPTEKAAYAARASSLGLSLGQFFREAGAAYGTQSTQAEEEALDKAAEEEAAKLAKRRPRNDLKGGIGSPAAGGGLFGNPNDFS